MELAGVLLVHAGLIVAVLAVLSVVRPIRFLGIRTRRTALAILGLGLVTIALGFAWPSREMHSAGAGTRLDEFAPAYQFHERHSVQIRAPRE